MEKIISGMTMLIGNVKENGRLADYLISQRIGDKTLRVYLQYLSREVGIEEEEHLQLLGSFLKAYSHHFKE